MKILFDTCRFWEEYTYVVLGVDLRRHHRAHPWKGWTLSVILFHRLFQVTYVNDYVTYSARMNRILPKRLRDTK